MRRASLGFFMLPALLTIGCENEASPVEAVIDPAPTAAEGAGPAPAPVRPAETPSTTQAVPAAPLPSGVRQDIHGVAVRQPGSTTVPAREAGTPRDARRGGGNWGYGIVRGGSAQNLPTHDTNAEASNAEQGTTAEMRNRGQITVRGDEVGNGTYGPAVVVGGAVADTDVGFGQRSTGVRSGAQTDVLNQEGSVVPAGVGEGGMTGFGRDARGAITGQTSTTDTGTQRGNTGVDATRREGGIVGTGAGEGGTTGFGRRPNDPTNPSVAGGGSGTRFAPSTPTTIPATGTAPSTGTAPGTAPATSGGSGTTSTTTRTGSSSTTARSGTTGGAGGAARGSAAPAGSAASGGSTGGAAGGAAGGSR